MRNGTVLHPADAGAWWRLVTYLSRRPARYRRREEPDPRDYVVLYGADVRTALSAGGVERAGLHSTQVSLVPEPGMIERCWADLEALPQNRDGTVSCGLCGALVRVRKDTGLYVHRGMEPTADGSRVADCKASGRTPAEARMLALREAAELDALRLRAHP